MVHWRLATPAVLLAAILCGCAANRITVTRSDAEFGPLVEMDFVGAAPGEQLQRCSGYSNAAYWEPSDPIRSRATDRATLIFPEGRSAVCLEIPPTDPCWPRWSERGVSQVIVFANTPARDYRPITIPILWSDHYSRWQFWYWFARPRIQMSLRGGMPAFEGRR